MISIHNAPRTCISGNVTVVAPNSRSIASSLILLHDEIFEGRRDVPLSAKKGRRDFYDPCKPNPTAQHIFQPLKHAHNCESLHIHCHPPKLQSTEHSAQGSQRFIILVFNPDPCIHLILRYSFLIMFHVLISLDDAGIMQHAFIGCFVQTHTLHLVSTQRSEYAADGLRVWQKCA